MLLRLHICSIGQAAAESPSGILPQVFCDDHLNEVGIMQKHGLLIQNDDSSFQLSALSTASTIHLGAPVPVRTLANNDGEKTVLELRNELVNDGWSLVDKASDCHVRGKICMRCQCSGYYQLLLGHRSEVECMTDFRAFSHSQSRTYYMVVDLLCSKYTIAAGQNMCFSLAAYHHLVSMLLMSS